VRVVVVCVRVTRPSGWCTTVDFVVVVVVYILATETGRGGDPDVPTATSWGQQTSTLSLTHHSKKTLVLQLPNC
jgi:hypothetical protein